MTTNTVPMPPKLWVRWLKPGRLQLANQFGEDAEIMDWLWDIDSNYGRVFLAGDLETIELRCLKMPFNPIQAKAVQYAVRQVAETGVFEDYFHKEYEIVTCFEVHHRRWFTSCLEFKTYVSTSVRPKV